MRTDYESADLREAKRQQNICACVCLWCSILTVAILLVCITVGVRYSGSHDVLEFSSSLGDTRLISYSPSLCSGGQMTISPGGYNGAMYFLDEEPPLSTWNILWLSGTFVIDPSDIEYYNFYNYDYGVIVYVAWEFHLNIGSKITARSCVGSASGGTANFLVIQGSHNYNRWIHNPATSSITAYEAALANCGSGQTLVYTFTANDEAYYYVVYYATSGAPQIYLGLNINRTEYSTSDISGMPNCTLDSDGYCSAESQSSSQYVLFQTIPADSNITEVWSFTLEWMCYSRDIVYVVMFFVPLIIAGLLLFGCFGVYCLCANVLCARYFHRSKYSELHEDHTHIHSQPVSEKVPPPYSANQPVSEKAPPPYGSGPI